MKTSKNLERYIENHCTQNDEVLNELYRQTHLKTLFTSMISGPVQGMFLEMISRMIAPQHILEIGTFTGYSAICLAKGLAEGGRLHTIERNDELETMIREYVQKAGMENKIVLHIGNALEILPSLNCTFDLVFIDAHKPEYSDYFDAIIDKVRTGGFILADNVLWYNKVAEPIAPNDLDTLGIVEFNKKIHTDPRVENMILPIRDGIMMMRKL